MECMNSKELNIAYDNNLIVENLNIKIFEKKITTIIGSNGCGKSTILKALGRLLKPKSGLIYLNGKDINSLNTKEIAKQIAILPQTPQAPDGLTVEELISYGRFPHQKGFGKLNSEDTKIIDWALSVTKLEVFRNIPIDNLSGGQRQRVWIAMALAQQTDLILLDEPTTYLDLSYQLDLLELLYKLNREQNRTIVMVLHDLNLASRFADYMIAIKKGKIISYGTPEEVMKKDILEKTFNIDANIINDPKTKKPTCISYDLIKV
ncbi:ABC transporter ATP-binding protein [Oceanotoga teriensis]|uniref:Iron complex transport system ATP-binding protein n=1 Tax=Oceanotoga teriensis TaxID=515440 RepID=A0AA45C7E8_9BACT|nr:ABC transporter ATP-binding protein [Oceanotoga teriensis]MDO7976780.1 ABC transporter ATP-binding protein [Oceanotoga teriensis]PWJ95289.1 iron complex transport system ATP-binding protein [Oceanotoga teriensis]